MIVTVRCPWCHVLNWIITIPQFCWNCGHRADVPRIKCDCIACCVTYGNIPDEMTSGR